MTDLSAGGLRSRTIDRTISGPKTPRAGRVGADPGHGLALAQWEYARADFRSARAAILGSQARRRAGIKQDRQGEVSDGTGLLREQRESLG